MKLFSPVCGVPSPAVLRKAFLYSGLLFALIGCTPEVPQPVVGQWDRIYSITPPELMRYGRSYAVDTLYFRYHSSASAASPEASSFPRLQAGLLEFSRGQTPDGFQAEQRGLFYDSLTGFTALSDGGLYPNRETNLHAPADSARFRFSGQPATGFLLQDRDGEVEIVAPPLRVLRDSQLGLARFALYAGNVEIRSRGAAVRPALLVFQRLYLPAVNSFDENAQRLWAARARLWLAIQDAEGSGASGGDIVYGREQGAVLNPLFATRSSSAGDADSDAIHESGGEASGDFAYLARARRDSPASREGPAGFESFPAQLRIAPAESGPQFTGDFLLQGRGGAASQSESQSQTRCGLQLSAVHTVDLVSISRADSRVAAVRGELKCPRQSYRLHGLMRVWPEGGE